MKLSKRLETIISMVPQTAVWDCVADVGTDHGFVPIALLELGRTRLALALDVREGPLKRAREHIRSHGLEERIETRLSDGLASLAPGEADVVVITGMGGELMLRILKEGTHMRDSVRYWVLSPQSELSLFRHGLEELGLAIRRETMLCEDGKYYTVMLAEPGEMHYEDEYRYRYGDCLIAERSPVLVKLLIKELKQYRQILAALTRQEGQAAQVRADEVRHEIKEMEAAYHAVCGYYE